MLDRINKTGFDNRLPCGKPSMDSSVVRNPQRVSTVLALAAVIRNVAHALAGLKLVL